jgi:hypothetical protein
MLDICWDMAVTHALTRRKPRHLQAQNGMDNPSASMGRTLRPRIFGLLLYSNFPNVKFLNILESLDEP